MTLAFGGQWTSPSMWTWVWNQKHHNVHQVQSSNVHKLLTCFLEKSDVLKFVVDICGWLSTCSPSVGDLAILALVSTSVPETSSEWDHPARHISACLGARTGEGQIPGNNAWHSCMSFLEGEKLLGPKLSSLVMAFKFAMSPDPLKALSHPCSPKRSVGRCPDGLCSFAHSGGAFCSPNVLGAAWMSFLGIFCSGHCNGFKGNHNKNTFHGVEDRIRCRTCCDELTLMVNLQLWSLSQCSWREQHWKHSKIKRAYLHLPHPAFTREAAQHSHFLSTCKLLLKLSFEADTMWPLASWCPKAWRYIYFLETRNIRALSTWILLSFVHPAMKSLDWDKAPLMPLIPWSVESAPMIGHARRVKS